MPPAKLAAGLALLGGVLWIVRAALGGGDGPVEDVLQVIGLACLVVASAVFGSTLVRSGAAGMRVLIGAASGLLTVALIEAFRPAGTPWYDGTWGVIATLIGGTALLRTRGRADGGQTSGAHAR
jgi:hypothetical protein